MDRCHPPRYLALLQQHQHPTSAHHHQAAVVAEERLEGGQVRLIPITTGLMIYRKLEILLVMPEIKPGVITPSRPLVGQAG